MQVNTVLVVRFVRFEDAFQHLDLVALSGRVCVWLPGLRPLPIGLCWAARCAPAWLLVRIAELEVLHAARRIIRAVGTALAFARGHDAELRGDAPIIAAAGPVLLEHQVRVVAPEPVVGRQACKDLQWRISTEQNISVGYAARFRRPSDAAVD